MAERRFWCSECGAETVRANGVLTYGCRCGTTRLVTYAPTQPIRKTLRFTVQDRMFLRQMHISPE